MEVTRNYFEVKLCESDEVGAAFMCTTKGPISENVWKFETSASRDITKFQVTLHSEIFNFGTFSSRVGVEVV